MLLLGSLNGLGSILLGTTGLTAGMQITAWSIGASCLGVNILIKFIPLTVIENLPLPKFEDQNAMKENPVTKLSASVREKVKKKTDDMISVGA